MLTKSGTSGLPSDGKFCTFGLGPPINYHIAYRHLDWIAGVIAQNGDGVANSIRDFVTRYAGPGRIGPVADVMRSQLRVVFNATFN